MILSDQKVVIEHLRFVEDLIANYYGTGVLFRSEDFLLNTSELKNQNVYGSMYILDEGSNKDREVFLGIYLHKSVVESIVSRPPIKRLDWSNLNEFLVLVEEVSHFCLITNRCFHGLPARLLELEVQAEIDKVLCFLFMLSNQKSSITKKDLMRIFFENVSYISKKPLKDLYKEASLVAARFFQGSLSEGRINFYSMKNMMNFLRKFYRMPFSEKFNSRIFK